MDVQKISYLCNGNADAVEFILRFHEFVIAWDDAVDQDKVPDEDRINAAMLWGLIGLQENPLYRANELVMRATIMQAVAAWQVANKFEKSKDRSLIEQAYFMRCAPYDVYSTVVFLAAGFDKQREAVEYFRSLAPEDSLAKYMAEIGDQNGLE